MLSKFLKLIAALTLLCVASVAYAATLLPPGEIQFFDNDGQPLSGGLVYFYIPGTSTPKSTYQNSAASLLNPNPVVLDSSGRAIIYGSGSYQETVKDANGNLIWSQVTTDTSATGYSWAGTSAGTANAQTLTAPNFAQTDGQIIGFIAGLSNSGAMTLTINGGSPINVVKATLSGAVGLTGGEVVLGNQYQVTYSSTNGNFQLVTYPFPTTIPIGNVTGLGAGVGTALTVALNGIGGLLSFQAPQVTVLTTGSSLTYTTPTGTRYISVEGVGGGSGGGGAGTTTSGGAGGAGGDTTFGAGLTAHGGAATHTSGTTTPSTPATATGGDVNISGGRGGNSAISQVNAVGPAAMSGADSMFGAGGAGSSFITNGSNVVVPATAGTGFGSGGGGGGPDITGSAFINTGFGGNSGAYFKKLITAPSATYTYTVGAAGSAGAAGASGTGGAAGAGGLIIVTAYFQ